MFYSDSDSYYNLKIYITMVTEEGSFIVLSLICACFSGGACFFALCAVTHLT